MSGNAHIKGKLELTKAFDLAKSADEMLKALKDMEACSCCFQENDLGMEYWKLTDQLYVESQDPEKILSVGKKALNILLHNVNSNMPCCFGKVTSLRPNQSHKSSFFVACTLNLLGFACAELKRYEESLSYLNWSNRNLSKLEEEEKDTGTSCCDRKCLCKILLANQELLRRVKVDMGRREDAVVHMVKILEIKEKTLEEGSVEIAEACKGVYGAYIAILGFDRALPFCLKAVEMYTKLMGQDSVEVAWIRREMAIIYNSLGESEKALEQNQMALNVLKKTASKSELLTLEQENGNMLLHLRRYDEGINLLKTVVSHPDLKRGTRASAYLSMAGAYCDQDKFSDAKKYMKLAQRILDRKDIGFIYAAVGFGDLAKMYKKMNDFETAISLIRRVLEIPELPQQLLIQNSERLFSLLSLSGKEKQGFSYLKDVVENLKNKLGPEHVKVGHGYNNLAVALLRSGDLDSSAKYMQYAKEILDASLGLDHLDSLKTSYVLALTYAAMKRYTLAVELQEKIIDSVKGLGLGERFILDETVCMLKLVKEAASGKVPESVFAEILRCDVLKDSNKVSSCSELPRDGDTRPEGGD